ncbi:MAG: type III-B CRISPR module RAMP protein Cmr4 [Acidobacteriota bacterium]|jgi:CRISPR-associated protein Cmr4
MFEEKRLMFLYCLSPVHMGAGQALGVVDNPIQRERHTGHPVFAGSGLKGALRDEFERAEGKPTTLEVFGPEAGNAEHAGAVAFTDAQVVLFPVRSLRESFVYATCPTALGRLKRAAELVGEDAPWSVPRPTNDDVCLVRENSGLAVKAKVNNADAEVVILEAFQFTAGIDKAAREQLGKVADWLAEKAIPNEESYAFFKDKLKKHLLVLTDTRFDYFVQNATTVEPHVRINDESGTADDGGLFYTENVPPEALFVSVAMASQQRVKRGESANGTKKAKEVINLLDRNLSGKVVQIGGDATAGRGLVAVSLAG